MKTGGPTAGRYDTMYETAFTPWASLGGGVLIGLSAVLLMLVLGRVMGATGILAGLFAPASTHDFTWRAALLLGMFTGPAVFWLATGAMPEITVPVSTPMLIVGGSSWARASPTARAAPRGTGSAAWRGFRHGPSRPHSPSWRRPP
jgi:hypothetical protein